MHGDPIAPVPPNVGISSIPPTEVPPVAAPQPIAGGGITRRRPWVWPVAAAAFAVVVAAVYGLLTTGGPRQAAPGSPIPAEVLFVRVSPAVVQVVIHDRQARQIGNGSGFLASKKGLIATNYHVIEKAHTAYVVFADETKLPVLGVAARDEEADIAIIVVAGPLSAQPLQLAEFDLPIGAKVYAIGNPLGLANTLSDGLISGHRELDGIGVIQTTAPISPGSSGGPLLGTDGKVVGVTTSGFKGGQNLNFAVPASHVARLLHQYEDGVQLTQFPLVRQSKAVAYLKRGNEWLDKKEFDKAMEDFNEAIRLDSNNSQAYCDRGHTWREKKEYDKAIKDFNEAVRLDPGFAPAYSGRGQALGRKKEHDKAFKDFTEAIRLDPKYAPAYSGRGNVWGSKKEYDKAFNDFNQAIRLDPKYAPAYCGRGHVWRDKKEFDKAFKDFNEAIRLDPKYAFAYYNRGFAWLQKKEYDEAIGDLVEAIWLDPNFAPAYVLYASLLATCPEEKVRDGKRAIQMATKACELTGWTGSLELTALAAAFAEDGDFDEAQRYQRNAITELLRGPLGDQFHLHKERFNQRLELYKQKKPYRAGP